MRKIAIDFGTTNTVVTSWREAANAPETIRLPGLSLPSETGQPPLIPSLLYVLSGDGSKVLAGHEVRAAGYDIQGDDRFFSSFKRGIGAEARTYPRIIDGEAWDDLRAGETFLRRVLQEVARIEGHPIDEIVLTVPVQSFERYLKWLRDETAILSGDDSWGGERVRIVDESTAAALGYEFRAPGELVLVFDFGGGTLDISLVRMPLADENSGIIFDRGELPPGLRARAAAAGGDTAARGGAKAARLLGGDDLDHWLLEDTLSRNGWRLTDVGNAYARLKLACEHAKVRLSTHETADFSVFDPQTARTYKAQYTRSQFDDLLDRHEFLEMVQATVDKVISSARQRGINRDDVAAVLLVGGSSQIPAVRRLLRAQFGSHRVHEHRPFEAVAQGALYLAAGVGLDDFIYHSYGIRHLSPISGQHEWEEIIPSGTRYPLAAPINLVLAAHRDGQRAIELVIGEVEESASETIEVMIGKRVLRLVEGGIETRRVRPINDEEGARVLAYLDPPGRANEDRVSVDFMVDHNRTLRVTVKDLQSQRTLLLDTPVVELR